MRWDISVMEVDVLLRSAVADKDAVLSAVVLLSLIPSLRAKMPLRSDDSVIFVSSLREAVGIVLLLL